VQQARHDSVACTLVESQVQPESQVQQARQDSVACVLRFNVNVDQRDAERRRHCQSNAPSIETRSMCLSAQFASFIAVCLTGCFLCAKTKRQRDRLPTCLSLCCTHTHTHTHWYKHAHTRTHTLMHTRTHTHAHTHTSSALRKLVARLKLSLAASMRRRSTMLRCTLALIAVCRKLYPVQKMFTAAHCQSRFVAAYSKEGKMIQFSVLSPFSPKNAA
jgi:hypothetical protein